MNCGQATEQLLCLSLSISLSLPFPPPRLIPTGHFFWVPLPNFSLPDILLVHCRSALFSSKCSLFFLLLFLLHLYWNLLKKIYIYVFLFFSFAILCSYCQVFVIKISVNACVILPLVWHFAPELLVALTGADCLSEQMSMQSVLPGN